MHGDHQQQLREAALTLYNSARWIGPGLTADQAAKQWEALREALGLEEGTSPPALPCTSEIEEALALVYGNRQADYGSPKENYEGIALVWSGLLRMILKRNITPEEAALMMAGLKLQRQCMKKKRDNIVDLIGYAIVEQRVEKDPSNA